MQEMSNNEQQMVHLRDNLLRKKIFMRYLNSIIGAIAFALVFYAMGWIRPDGVGWIGGFLQVLIPALSITLTACSLFSIAENLCPKNASPLKLLIKTFTLCIVGAMMGWHIGVFILYLLYPETTDFGFGSKQYFREILFILFFSGIIAYFIYFYERLKETKKEAEEERLNRLASDKQALEANLRLLQAQIEPHFLFNTLSNILSLIDTTPSRAKSMLMDFNLYLRTSLATTRPDMTTLDEEIDTIKAYLNIQKIRLGERLNYSIEIPEILLQQPFPPLLLQPLVENAVKHGLEPDIKGGDVKITASGENGVMRIIVADTGQGFSSYNKDGIGIKNIKERIKLIYGEKGHLSLEEKNPNGVEAVIEVPKNDI